MGGQKALFLVVVTLAVVTACSGQRGSGGTGGSADFAADPSPTRTAPGSAAPDPGAAAAGESSPGSSTASSQDPVTSASEDTAGTAGSSPRNHNNGVVRLRLSARCVLRGQTLTVSISAPSDSVMAMVIGYSDGRAHTAMGTAHADARGEYVWRVVVEPTVPPGEATALVQATGPRGSREGGGSASETFRVAETVC